MKLYSTRLDRQAQLNRWLRRGTTGLVSGLSEAPLPVTLGQARTGGRVGAAGANGGAGLPGAAGMSRGCKMWSGTQRNFAFANTTPESFGIVWGAGFDTAPGGGPLVVIATNDIEAMPRLITRATGVNNQRRNATTSAPFRLGLGNGRAGFLAVWRFGFPNLAATRQWFVGMQTATGTSTTTTATGPSVLTSMIGVGQDAADTSPQFMHNNASGTATKVSTGLANIVANRLYKLTLFADPFGTEVDLTFQSFVGGVSSGLVTYHASADLPSGTDLAATVLSNAGSVGALTEMAFFSFYAEIQPWPG